MAAVRCRCSKGPGIAAKPDMGCVRLLFKGVSSCRHARRGTQDDCLLSRCVETALLANRKMIDGSDLAYKA